MGKVIKVGGGGGQHIRALRMCKHVVRYVHTYRQYTH